MTLNIIKTKWDFPVVYKIHRGRKYTKAQWDKRFGKRPVLVLIQGGRGEV